MSLVHRDILAALGMVSAPSEQIMICKSTEIMRRAKRSCILFCTSLRISIFHGKRSHKAFKLHQEWHICQITSINVTDSRTLELQLKSNPGELLSIFDDQAPEIAIVLSNYFVDVLRADQRPRISAAHGVAFSANLHESPSAFLSCVKYQASTNGYTLPENVIDTMTDLTRSWGMRHLLGVDVTIDLTAIPESWQYRDILFYAIGKSEMITKVVIPDWSSVGQSGWYGPMALIKQNKEIRQLELHEMLGDMFDIFIRALQTNHTVDTIAFSGPKYDKKSVEMIAKLVTSCPQIRTVRFETELNEEASTFLYEQASTFSNLDRLEFVNVIGPTIEVYAGFAMCLKSLIVRNCGLDLFDLVVLLSLDGLRVEEVDASGNVSDRPLMLDMNVQSSVSSYVLRDVEWRNDNLVLFLRILDKCACNGFKLDISSAKMSEEAWISFKCFVQTPSLSRMKEFVFYDNRLSKSLVNYLMAIPSLECVGIRGGLVAGHELVNRVCQFIATSSTLRELHVRGKKRDQLGRALRHVLNAANVSTSLRCLDIRDQGMGRELIPELKSLLETNRKIDEIMIDGNGLLDVKGFQQFVEELKARKSRFNLHAPVNDLVAVAEKNHALPASFRKLVADINAMKEMDLNQEGEGETRLDNEDVPDGLSRIRRLCLEDTAWEVAMNHVSSKNSIWYYEKLSRKFDLEGLLITLQRTK